MEAILTMKLRIGYLLTFKNGIYWGLRFVRLCLITGRFISNLNKSDKKGKSRGKIS